MIPALPAFLAHREIQDRLAHKANLVFPVYRGLKATSGLPDLVVLVLLVLRENQDLPGLQARRQYVSVLLFEFR